MDCISSEVRMEFLFFDLRTDSNSLERIWEKLLNIVCDFEIRVAGCCIYKEEDFPVVEFASQVNEWVADRDGGFKYISMEAEDPLIVFDEWGRGNLRIISACEDTSDVILDRQDVIFSVKIFIEKLKSEIQDKLGVDVDGIL